ncbi:hypothetical protein O6H91_13G014200 [Diphasiastrum complanatum]|nr:hypothetical protein O6H91_13G014200 [Diphasiastrum complanatum]
MPEPSLKKFGKGTQQSEKKAKTPTIFYATRTHSQISQVIQEFRKTTYRVPMAVLAARKHYCTNKQVRKKENIDEDCKLLLKDPEHACPYFKNANKLRNHSSIQLGGIHEVHDIEDLVSLGHAMKGCAYFAARALSVDAEIVFCPYSYIVNPIIRKAMDVDLRGAIVILDEAHNIEDVARESGSVDLETTELEEIQTELEQLTSSGASVEYYQPLLEMIQEMLIWAQQQANFLSKRDPEHYSSCWNGDKALRELRAAGISLDAFPILLDCAEKVIKAASDPDEAKLHLSIHVACLIEGLFVALKFMLKSPARVGDYQLVIQKYLKRDEGVQRWVYSVSLWCLNPGVVFEDVAAASRSIILTSGTLSPLSSFASELGVPFEICMEGPHVIDMSKQVWAAALSVGPGSEPLNASYKHAETYTFQDAVGAALENICKVVPGGALIFFPSYKLLDKLCRRWKATGQWARLSEDRRLFVEPRGNRENFELILAGYYESIAGISQKTKTSKLAKGTRSINNDNLASRRGQTGAAFLAVCRGKVSEGIDFSDENARVVIVVGIPFPNVKDIQVSLKKEYNNRNKISKNLLGGDQWYCHQAFRALNQAVGRCIRHRNDFGAIILLDERFKQSNYLEYMSKWLRKAITKSDNFEQSLEDLAKFFKTFRVLPSYDGSINSEIPSVHKQTGAFNGLCSASTILTSIDSPEKSYSSNPHTEMLDTFKWRVCDSPVAVTNNILKESCSNYNLLSFETFSPSKNQNDKNSSLCSMGICQEEEASVVCTWQQMQNLEASLAESDDITMIRNTIRVEEQNSEELVTNSWRKSIVDSALQNGFSYSCSSETCKPPQCVSSFAWGESLATPPHACTEKKFFQKMDSSKLQSDSFDMKVDECQPNNLLHPIQCSSSKPWVRKCSLRDKKRKVLESVSSRLFEKISTLDDISLIENASLEIDEDLIDGNGMRRSTTATKSDCEDDALLVCSTLSKECDEPAGNQFDPPDLTGLEDATLLTKATFGAESSVSVSTENETQNYLLSCIKCGHSVGTVEKNLFVSCYTTTLQKPYLRVLQSMQDYSVHTSVPCSSKGQQKSESTVHVYITEPDELDSSLTIGKEKFTGLQPTTECTRCMPTSEHAVWVKEDGCVFEPIHCTWCVDIKSPIGARILAADRTNSLLASKVAIFQDRMKAMPVTPAMLDKKNNQCKQSTVLKSGSPSNRYGTSRDQCDQLKKSERVQMTTLGKGKLKLPKKDSFRSSMSLYPS